MSDITTTTTALALVDQAPSSLTSEIGDARALEQNDELLRDLARAYVRGGRLQAIGMVAVALAVPAVALTTALPWLPVLCVAMLANNYVADRAIEKECEALGVSRALARKMLRKTYLVPECFELIRTVVSYTPALEAKTILVLKKALAKIVR